MLGDAYDVLEQLTGMNKPLRAARLYPQSPYLCTVHCQHFHITRYDCVRHASRSARAHLAARAVPAVPQRVVDDMDSRAYIGQFSRGSGAFFVAAYQARCLHCLVCKQPPPVLHASCCTACWWLLRCPPSGFFFSCSSAELWRVHKSMCRGQPQVPQISVTSGSLA